MERGTFPALIYNDFIANTQMTLRSKRLRSHCDPPHVPSSRNLTGNPSSIKQYFRTLKSPSPRQFDTLYAKPEPDRPIKLSRYQSDFTEIKLIGKGSFGEVFECKHNLDASTYAVKRIRAHKHRPHILSRGLAEARALASLDDTRYVVRYHSAWLEKDSLFISMELCEAPLSACWQSSGFAEEQLFKVLYDVSKGLKMMQEKGRVHLDIKPDNILLSRAGKFKLADFGMSRAISELATEISEGDARYLAPELLDKLSMSPSDLDLPKVDIFSLGATLLEILRQRGLPSNGPEWHAIRNGELNMPPCSAELAQLIGSMLARNPKDRPTPDQILRQLGCRGPAKKLKINQ